MHRPSCHGATRALADSAAAPINEGDAMHTTALVRVGKELGVAIGIVFGHKADEGEKGSLGRTEDSLPQEGGLSSPETSSSEGEGSRVPA